MSLRPQERLFVLKMKWLCGACNTENICNIPFETHFFDVLLITKRDHARLGANAVIAPGALILPGTVVPRLGLVDQRPR